MLEQKDPRAGAQVAPSVCPHGVIPTLSPLPAKLGPGNPSLCLVCPLAWNSLPFECRAGALVRAWGVGGWRGRGRRKRSRRRRGAGWNRQHSEPRTDGPEPFVPPAREAVVGSSQPASVTVNMVAPLCAFNCHSVRGIREVAVGIEYKGGEPSARPNTCPGASHIQPQPPLAPRKVLLAEQLKRRIYLQNSP